MTGNTYRYAMMDLSMLLQKNISGISRNNPPGTYTAGDLVKSIIYTINKFPRDFGITADKYILLSDKWLSDYPGYYTTKIVGGAYKDSRGDIKSAQGKADPKSTYMTDEIYQQLVEEGASKEILEKAYSDLYRNKVRHEAKEILLKELCYFGIPAFYIPGWEYDNLAYVAAEVLKTDNKKSVFIARDSDIMYVLNDNVDYFSVPTSKEAKEKNYGIKTFSDVCSEIPNEILDKVSLYEYKTIIDSFGSGHNGLRCVKKKKFYSNIALAQEIIEGDLSNLTDLEQFELQKSTFNVHDYPEYQEAVHIITDLFPTAGSISTFENWTNWCNSHKGLEGLIQQPFYNKFISRFDKNLFTL